MRTKLMIGTLIAGGLSVWLWARDGEPERRPADPAATEAAAAPGAGRSPAGTTEPGPRGATRPARRPAHGRDAEEGGRDAPRPRAAAHGDADHGAGHARPAAVPADAVDTDPDPHQASYEAQMDEVDEKLDRDPVAQVVPMLFDTPPEKQLETLQWMKELPRDKLLSAIPSLNEDRSLPIAARRELALAMVEDLIRKLQQESRR